MKLDVILGIGLVFWILERLAEHTAKEEYERLAFGNSSCRKFKQIACAIPRRFIRAGSVRRGSQMTKVRAGSATARSRFEVVVGESVVRSS